MKHENKWIKRYILLCLSALAIGLLITGCTETEHKTKEKKDTENEIVWYITYPDDYVEDRSTLKAYEEINSKRFELFNDRLKELGIPAKVTFKYLPDQPALENTEEAWNAYFENEFKYSATSIKTLLQEDPEADIAMFSPVQYRQFLELDSYFNSEYMKKAKSTLPEKIWEVCKINGNTYQIPRGNTNIQEPSYCFAKGFLKQYQITLNEEKLRQMTPQEVIEWLLPYFEENRIAGGKYYLTSAQELCYEDYFSDKKIPILSGTNNTFFLDLKTKQVSADISEGFELYDWIYKNDIDAHTTRTQERSVFTITTHSNQEKLQRIKEDNSYYQNVSLGNPRLMPTSGNGVLKESKDRELAIRVLAASVYDEELSNLMIHGIPEEDYNLKDGYAVYTDSGKQPTVGSPSPIGNNLIAYPSEAEFPDKFEKTEQLLSETPIIPYSNFAVDLSDEKLLEKTAKIVQICWNAMNDISNSEIPDLKIYLDGQQEKLKKAGIDEVITEFQKQADEWEE